MGLFKYGFNLKKSHPILFIVISLILVTSAQYRRQHNFHGPQIIHHKFTWQKPPMENPSMAMSAPMQAWREDGMSSGYRHDDDWDDLRSSSSWSPQPQYESNLRPRLPQGRIKYRPQYYDSPNSLHGPWMDVQMDRQKWRVMSNGIPVEEEVETKPEVPVKHFYPVWAFEQQVQEQEQGNIPKPQFFEGHRHNFGPKWKPRIPYRIQKFRPMPVPPPGLPPINLNSFNEGQASQEIIDGPPQQVQAVEYSPFVRMPEESLAIGDPSVLAGQGQGDPVEVAASNEANVNLEGQGQSAEITKDSKLTQVSQSVFMNSNNYYDPPSATASPVPLALPQFNIEHGELGHSSEVVPLEGPPPPPPQQQQVEQQARRPHIQRPNQMAINLKRMIKRFNKMCWKLGPHLGKVICTKRRRNGNVKARVQERPVSF